MEQETVFWESVRDSDQITDVQAYLDQYPNGRFAALARNRIRRLRNATDTQPDKLEPSRMKLDLAFWQSIKGSQTSGDYEAYLVQFPNGQFARLARARIATAALELEETARFAREAAETKRAASKGTEGVALAPSIQDDNSQERKNTTNDRAIEAKILEQVYVFFHTVVWSQEKWKSVGRKKAAAICIDWETSSPDEIAILDSGGGPDDFAWGATWNASKVAHATAGAVNKCVDVRTSKKLTCKCVVVYENDKQTLQIPQSFVARFAKD